MVVAEFARTELAEDVLFFFNCVVITTKRGCHRNTFAPEKRTVREGLERRARLCRF